MPDHESAVGRTPVSRESLAAFDRVSAQVEDQVVASCLADGAAPPEMGPRAEAMIKSGLGFVTRMLRATMQFAAEGILRDEIEWSSCRLPVYGVPSAMVLDNLERYAQSLERALSGTAFAEIEPYLELLIKMQRQVVTKDGVRPSR
jgi:hypothetical protein